MISSDFKLEPTDRLAVEYLWEAAIRIFATQLPRVEEWFPVDVRNQAGKVVVLKDAGPDECWRNCE